MIPYSNQRSLLETPQKTPKLGFTSFVCPLPFETFLFYSILSFGIFELLHLQPSHSIVARMPSHGTMTAAQRALGIAEIIGLIISFVPSGWFASSNALIHCGLVNKLWLGEVLPVIWSHIGTQIERVFTKLKPGRRQFYANFVVFAESCILNDGLCSKDLSQNLKDIVFPKMETILMFTCGERGECSLPRMNCPNLYRMTFQDMDYENEEKEDDMCPDAWESIFWDISVCAHSTLVLEYSQR